MGNPRYGLRAAAPLGCAALGLHELRYLIAYGDQSGDELARQGHAYLPFVTVAAATLLALACAQLLAALSRARRSGAPGGGRPAGWKLWLAASAGLLLVHVGQELLEGALAAGHARGLAAVAADGGWVCLPLALAFGALVALALRGAEAAVRAAARSARGPLPARTAAKAARPRSARLARASSPLATKLGSRAPPLPV